MSPRKKAKTAGGQASRIQTAATNRSGGGHSNRSTVQVRRGSLKAFFDLPVEIRLMILEYLSPKDLLNMSRICKELRLFLLDKSNNRLWDRVLRNAFDELPPRPSCLSVPKFAHLLVSTRCHNCGYSGVTKLAEGCFARYCLKCTKSLSVPHPEALRELVEADEALKQTFLRGSNNYFTDVVSPPQNTIVRLWKKEIHDVITRFKNLEQPTQAVMIKEFLDTRKREHQSRMEAVGKIQAWLDSQAACGDDLPQQHTGRARHVGDIALRVQAPSVASARSGGADRRAHGTNIPGTDMVQDG